MGVVWCVASLAIISFIFASIWWEVFSTNIWWHIWKEHISNMYIWSEKFIFASIWWEVLMTFLWGGIQYIRFWLSLLQWKYAWTTCIDFVRTCSCESGILFTHLWQHFCGINVEYALEEMTREIPRSRHICLISHKPSNLMKNIYLCNQFLCLSHFSNTF